MDFWGSHRVVRRKGLLSGRAESKKGCGCLVAHMRLQKSPKAQGLAGPEFRVCECFRF